MKKYSLENNEYTGPIIHHFTDDDLYKFTMQWAVICIFPRMVAEYEFKDRKNTVYPENFDKSLRIQLNYLKELIITEEEIQFMKSKLYFIPEVYYNFLRGFRFDTDNIQIHQSPEGHLRIRYQGYWWQKILLEVKILCIVSELYHRITGNILKVDLDEYYNLTFKKGLKMFHKEISLPLSEFGTRRRLSFNAQDVAIQALINASKDPNSNSKSFIGTSNVYFAMKYNLTPIGTMAHEWISGIAAIYGPQNANYLAMKYWKEVYKGSLGIFLYDTFGFEAFSRNFTEEFALAYRGLRVDSGKNLEQLELIYNLYQKYNIDPKTKQVMFSNALNTDTAITIRRVARDICKDGYGMGTHITCDTKIFGFNPLEIVIKLIAAKITEKEEYMNSTCKLSNDLGKNTGDPETIKRFKALIHCNS